MIKLAPSILSADFSCLGEEVRKIERSGADYVHIDVMDGHFVPNITLGPPVIKRIRPVTKLVFDVHLMIENPEKYIKDFSDAGADIITVHIESCTHLDRVIQLIRENGKRVGVSLNPATPLEYLKYILEKIDMVLLMSVNPGFGGQKYIPQMTKKIEDLRELINDRNLDVDLEIDGGVGLENIQEVTKAGANVIVSGSAFFKAADAKTFIKEMHKRSEFKGK